MNRYIEIVEDKDKELVETRFKNKIRYYKFRGSAVIIADVVVIVLLAIGYIAGKSNAMNIGIFLAVVAAFTIPLILSAFNKVWQLSSDIESKRVQIVSGRVDKLKVEISGKRKFNIIFMDRTEIPVDDVYCEPFAVNDKINIRQGISSRIAISAVKIEE